MRRYIVKLYLRVLLYSRGLFSSKNRVFIVGLDKADLKKILIYPCNKKIRIFNFFTNTVNVISKAGFPTDSIRKEIEFRKEHKSQYIVPLIQYGSNWYSEEIIAGKPLARIQNPLEYRSVKEKALGALKTITNPYKRMAYAAEYKNQILREINNISGSILDKYTSVQETLGKIVKQLNEELTGFDDTITLTMSHGDFHHGNIWMKNKGGDILLIDWETSDIRTEWYDIFTLYGGLRELNGIKDLLQSLRMGKFEIAKFPDKITMEKVVFLVLLEEVLFRIVDLRRTPIQIGIGDFEEYIKDLLRQITNYRKESN